MASSSRREWSLAFQIGAKLQSSFPAAFKSAEKQIAALQKAASNTGKSWENLSKKAASLRRSIFWVGGAAAGLGAALFGMSNSVANQAAAISDSAQRLGWAVEPLQEWQYAAEKAGMSSDKFTAALQQSNLTIANTLKNKKAIQAFGQEYGIDVRKMAGLPPEKAMLAVAEEMKKLKTPAEKLRLATALYGKAVGPEMVAFLEQGADAIVAAGDEARKYNLILTENEIAQGKAFDDAKKLMLKQVGAIKNTVGTKFLPIFTRAFERITQKIQDNMPAIQAFAQKLADGVERIIPKIEALIGRIVDFGKRLWEVVQKVKDFVGGWGNLGIILAGLRMVPVLFAAATFAMNAYRLAAAAAKVAQVAFNIAMSANPLGLIVLAIAAVIGGFILLYKKCEGFRNIVNKVVSAVVGFFKAAGKWIVNAWNIAITAIVDHFKWRINLIKTIIGAVVDFFKNAVELIKAAWNAIPDFFVWLWQTVTGGISAFVDSAVGFITSLPERIWEIIQRIPEYFAQAWENVKAGVSAFIDAVKAKFAPFLDFFDNIKNKISDIFGGIGAKIGAVKDKFAGVFGGGNAAQVPGHAAGGIFTRPHVASFAENAPRVPEAAIPVENTARSYDLWRRTGEMAGFGGGGAARPLIAPIMAGGGGATSISLSMPINIGGNATPETVRALESSRDNMLADVKKMVNQALNERTNRQQRLSYGI